MFNFLVSDSFKFLLFQLLLSTLWQFSQFLYNYLDLHLNVEITLHSVINSFKVALSVWTTLEETIHFEGRSSRFTKRFLKIPTQMHREVSPHLPQLSLSLEE